MVFASARSISPARSPFASLACTLLSVVALAGAAQSAAASLAATASITTAQSSAPYNYTVTLHNTGTTNIGTFWFAWTNTPASYDFLPSIPSAITGPSGWVSPITHNAFPGDRYGIEWYNIGGSSISPGSDGIFHFTSNDSPATLAGASFFPGFNILHSVVYVGFPQTDPGYHFDVAIPAPAGALSFVGLAALTRRRRTLA